MGTEAPSDDGRTSPARRLVDLTLSRRGVLRGAAAGVGGAGMMIFAGETASIAVAPGGSYLTAAERRLLAAVLDRVVPGQPEDPAVGAVQTGCVEAVDALLGAFGTSPPRIYAGAPFSDRGGSPVNHFTEFLPLDPYEERAWRLRIEGGPGVVGFQQVYREGLAALARSNVLFASLPGPLRDLALRSATDAKVVAMRDLAVTHALEFYFAAPEYGGNRATGAWKAVGFEGDRQPRGFTREEVDDPAYAPLPLLSPPLGSLVNSLLGSLLGALTSTVSGVLAVVAGRAAMPAAAAAAAPVLPLSASEASMGLVAGGGDHRSVQDALGELFEPLTDPGSPASRRLAAMHRRAAELVAEAQADGGLR